MSETSKVTIIKCQCGDSACNRYGLSEGSFNQGNGWEKERAQEYADAINYYDGLAQRNADLDAERA